MQFLGYNFLSDQDSLNPTYNRVENIAKTRQTKAIFDEFFFQKTSTNTFDVNKNSWDINTILLAKFQDDTKGGNISFTGLTVNKLRIKRRKIEEMGNWLSLNEYDFEKNKELYDYFAESNQEYEYALVPIMADGTEGSYTTTQITSEFEKCFLLDSSNSYNLYYDLKFDDMNRNINTNIYEPLGSKYPIIVKNGLTNYESGGLNALVISSQTETLAKGVVSSSNIDKRMEIKHRKELMDFLTNGQAKILKDSNGNIWLIGIPDKPSAKYMDEMTQAIATISFKWVELGDATNQTDLYDNGLISVL